MNVPEKLSECWHNVGERRPLVYHVTNSVAAQFQADLTLAVGGSPIMSPAADEAAELAKVADAVLVNIGTPTDSSIDTIHAAMRSATQFGTPILLDPVGYGATAKRVALVDELLRLYPVAVIKGNAAEIAFMADRTEPPRGVDASESVGRSNDAAFWLARKYETVVAVTGEADYVSDGKRVFEIRGGNAMIGRITAGGCGVGSLIAAILGASGDSLASVLAGLIAMGQASEMAVGAGPGTFRASLLDQLYGLAQTGLGSIEERLSLQDRIV